MAGRKHPNRTPSEEIAAVIEWTGRQGFNGDQPPPTGIAGNRFQQ